MDESSYAYEGRSRKNGKKIEKRKEEEIEEEDNNRTNKILIIRRRGQKIVEFAKKIEVSYFIRRRLRVRMYSNYSTTSVLTKTKEWNRILCTTNLTIFLKFPEKLKNVKTAAL